MGRTLKETIASLPKARRRAIKKRTAALIAARRKRNVHVGSDFEDFLADEGRLQESTALAIKRVLAWELERVMKETNVSQAELARRMKTSRAVVHRLLDATDSSVTLSTISKAATALGRSVRVALAA